MSQVTLPYTLTAGQPENVNQLVANLNAIVAGVNAVDASQIDSGLLQQAGLTGNSIVRRGKFSQAAAETRTNTVFGTLGTPDQVTNLVLPTDGLIFVLYHALWQESVVNTARAGIHLNGTLVNTSYMNAASGGQLASINATSGTAKYQPLLTSAGGLVSIPVQSAMAVTGNATESLPQIVGGSDPAVANYSINPYGGVTAIAAAAGTYTVDIRFRSSSGDVTVKNRHLWVWTQGF